MVKAAFRRGLPERLFDNRKVEWIFDVGRRIEGVDGIQEFGEIGFFGIIFYSFGDLSWIRVVKALKVCPV